MKSLCMALLCLVSMPTSFASPNLDIDRVWTGISDPLIMSQSFERSFSALPTAGIVIDRTKYWSSGYWPRFKGGINYRWNSSNPTGFNLVSPSKAEAASMSLEDLKALSPSEKWDLFIGRYDYPTKKEVNNYASPTRPEWEGICHGWSGAALNEAEPKPITVVNPDGIQIPFGSSDLKGLLSWYYAKKHSATYARMGRRCYESLTGEETCDEDLNAGAFHIVLTNKLGVKGEGFVADVEQMSQVWNHLAYKFLSTVKYNNLPPRETSAPGTVSVARVKSVVYYVFVAAANWDPVLGTSSQNLEPRTYEYYLDLDASGRIIGGDWISSERPDFLWLEKKAQSFKGLFKRLPEVLPKQSRVF